MEKDICEKKQQTTSSEMSVVENSIRDTLKELYDTQELVNVLRDILNHGEPSNEKACDGPVRERGITRFDEMNMQLTECKEHIENIRKTLYNIREKVEKC